MKHIKPYKLFESKIQEIQDIEDILLELEDIGHKVYIEDFVVKSIGKPGLEIVITSEESAGAGMVRTANKLLPLDIGDYLLRVDSYLKDLRWVGHNPYDYENHQVNVKATLKDIKLVFKKEINEFDKYLNQGGFLAAPFNTVSVSYFKKDSLVIEGYNKPREGKKRWSVKYKKSINCNNPKGFSQKQYCKRKKSGGKYKTNESVDQIKSDLNDIFLDLTDRTSEDWFVYIDKEWGGNGLEYHLYISFGDEEAYDRRIGEDDWFEDPDYKEVQISEDLLDSIERSIDYMSDLGFNNKIKIHTEYNSDPSQDDIQVINIDDIKDGQWMQENESIRIVFKK